MTGWKGSWFEGDNVPLAVLRLDASARWVAERYPVRSTTELPDGGLEVVLPVATERWLARLLLRLGTRGSVVSPAEWEHLGADAAASVLARALARLAALPPVVMGLDAHGFAKALREGGEPRIVLQEE